MHTACIFIQLAAAGKRRPGSTGGAGDEVFHQLLRDAAHLFGHQFPRRRENEEGRGADPGFSRGLPVDRRGVVFVRDQVQAVPDPVGAESVCWLVVYSGLPRILTDTDYNHRVAECRQAAKPPNNIADERCS